MAIENHARVCVPGKLCRAGCDTTKQMYTCACVRWTMGANAHNKYNNKRSWGIAKHGSAFKLGQLKHSQAVNNNPLRASKYSYFKMPWNMNVHARAKCSCSCYIILPLGTVALLLVDCCCFFLACALNSLAYRMPSSSCVEILCLFYFHTYK